MTYVAGVSLTPFGKLPGRSTLDLMSEAASAALADAQLTRPDVDGLLCGYSTTFPHLMLSTVFAEHFGLSPVYAHAVQLGGAMAHLVETQLQMTGRAGSRQVRDASLALLHGDGGVQSSHVTLIVEAE